MNSDFRNIRLIYTLKIMLKVYFTNPLSHPSLNHSLFMDRKRHNDLELIGSTMLMGSVTFVQLAAVCYFSLPHQTERKRGGLEKWSRDKQSTFSLFEIIHIYFHDHWCQSDTDHHKKSCIKIAVVSQPGLSQNLDTSVRKNKQKIFY